MYSSVPLGLCLRVMVEKGELIAVSVGQHNGSGYFNRRVAFRELNGVIFPLGRTVDVGIRNRAHCNGEGLRFGGGCIAGRNFYIKRSGMDAIGFARKV